MRNLLTTSLVERPLLGTDAEVERNHFNMVEDERVAFLIYKQYRGTDQERIMLRLWNMSSRILRKSYGEWPENVPINTFPTKLKKSKTQIILEAAEKQNVEVKLADAPVVEVVEVIDNTLENLVIEIIPDTDEVDATSLAKNEFSITLDSEGNATVEPDGAVMPLTVDAVRELQEALAEVDDELDELNYIDIKDCRKSGQHLQSVDGDGYCNICGEQDE